jgi:hypothetical protein
MQQPPQQSASSALSHSSNNTNNTNAGSTSLPADIETQIGALAAAISTMEVARREVEKFDNERRELVQRVLQVLGKAIDQSIRDASAAGLGYTAVVVPAQDYKTRLALPQYHLPLVDIAQSFARQLRGDTHRYYVVVDRNGPVIHIAWTADGQKTIATKGTLA